MAQQMNGTFPELVTARLVLRAWKTGDEAAFAELNADAVVTQYLLGPFTLERSNAQVESFREHFAKHGFGRWAVELPGEASFIGTEGLSVVPYASHFTPSVEVAWRLARPYWGRGFASEAARAALSFGFEHARLQEIVALTVPANARSRAVMERLGMTRKPEDDFDHPVVPDGHALKRHVLYRMSNRAWADLARAPSSQP